MALEGAMPGLQAGEELRENGIRCYSDKDVFRMALLATGNKEYATDLAVKRRALVYDDTERAQRRQ